MKTRWLAIGLCTALLCGQLLAADKAPAKAADSGLPKRDVTVELRQIEEGRDTPGSYSAGSTDNSTWEPQTVQVRNGEKALLNMHESLPMQWTQSVSTQSLPSNGSGGSNSNSSANNNAVSVNNALAWFDAGQSIAVQPKWPGGNKPAVLVIEVQRAAVDQRMGAEPPKQTRNTLSTTITVPLAEWVTIAVTGKAVKPGTYSSESSVMGRKLLQVRVMVP